MGKTTNTPPASSTPSPNPPASTPAANSASSAPAPGASGANPSATETETPPSTLENGSSTTDSTATTPSTSDSSTVTGPSKTARKSAKKEAVTEFVTPTLDKTEEELTIDEVDEVVVTVGPIQKMVGNKAVTVQAAHTAVYKAAFWQSLYRHKNGDVVQFPASLDGYPIYDELGNWASTGPIVDTWSAPKTDAE